ncbi:MAG: HAMP domain-containing sensor histidine kinase [Bacteroidota bacterium]
MKLPVDKLSQLEAENDILRQENHQLRADNTTALFKLEKQISIEKRYEESQSRFETIFNKSKMGNKIIAPDLSIIQINEVFQVMLGYTEQEIVGTKIIAFAHPDFIYHWHELQDNLWTKQIPSFQIETCLVKKDGSVLWCQVTSIIFRDNDATLGYTIVEDISKRKALELELKKLYEYQETIMHMVAHDLKSPINNIKSLNGFLKKNLEQLQHEVASEKKEQNLTFIHLIADTCEKAYTIIKDLLLIGEFQSNHNFEKTDLKTFIESALPILEVEAKQKEIEISFHYPEEPIYAHINEDKFTRVLENLLSNAVKFTHTGGQVTIALKNEGRRVILQVSDNGIGIPKNLQSSIFNMFTKASRKGTEGETTTGLGLYIVKQIVEMHKGTISVESQENVGTSFFIELN